MSSSQCHSLATKTARWISGSSVNQRNTKREKGGFSRLSVEAIRSWISVTIKEVKNNEENERSAGGMKSEENEENEEQEESEESEESEENEENEERGRACVRFIRASRRKPAAIRPFVVVAVQQKSRSPQVPDSESQRW
jgi:TATA-binding protein-associated factor Taf7